MIIDLPKFMESERPCWTELEGMLTSIEHAPGSRLSFGSLQRFHYLYERTAADLARLVTFSSEPELRRYLESLVARAYGEVHETRRQSRSLGIFTWFFGTLPQTFRRHLLAFWLALAVTVAGAVFGGMAVAFDLEAKEALLPEMFANHQSDPRDRVAKEEGRVGETGTPKVTDSPTRMIAFSAFLMQNNISVSIKTLAFGLTFGFGTLVTLLHNGVVLGVVATDYILAGETVFLLGWLLPHGVIEIPAILISAQAGLVLANALIGWGSRDRLRGRLRRVGGDLATLIGGVALLLVWAGLIEAFFSQFHEPVVPYGAKIAFGVCELMLFVAFLIRGGAAREGAAQVPRPKGGG